MNANWKTCLHPKERRKLVAVRVSLQCKDCEEYFISWLKDTNLMIVSNELEYEIKDLEIEK